MNSYYLNIHIMAKSMIVKDKKSTTEYTTLGGTFFTKKKETVKFKLANFLLIKQ
jgi:hypothetical protein